MPRRAINQLAPQTDGISLSGPLRCFGLPTVEVNLTMIVWRTMHGVFRQLTLDNRRSTAASRSYSMS